MLLLSCCGTMSAAADEKLTHLHFYFHEVVAGAPNATVVKVASLHKYVSYISLTLLTTHDHDMYTKLKLDARAWLCLSSLQGRTAVWGRERLRQRAA
jgi:hypothetical protein